MDTNEYRGMDKEINDCKGNHRASIRKKKGDTGNDYIAGKWAANGRDAEGYFEWTFPDGTVVAFENAVINVTACNAGDSTNVGPLEFDVMSNGKPTITPAV